MADPTPAACPSPQPAQSAGRHWIDPSPMQRFTVLDSFRGLCAMFVVLHHTRVVGAFSEHMLFRHAGAFVEFFFVLSGFVLMHVYGARRLEPQRFRRFLITRTLRLAPLHLALLAVFVLLEFAKLGAATRGVSFSDPAFTGPKAPGELLPNVLLLQAWLPGAESESFNFPAWSISVEFYMYVIFGGLLTAVYRLRIGAFLLLAVGALVALYSGAEFPKLAVLRGLSCFFTGALAYSVYLRLRDLPRNRAVMSLLEVLCLVLVYALVVSSVEYKTLLGSLLFASTILVFAFEQGVLSGWLRAKPFAHLGQLSYSIYMTHAAFLAVLLAGFLVLGKLGGSEYALMWSGAEGVAPIRYLSLGEGWANQLLVVGILLVVVLISRFTYRYIELPGQRLGRRLTKPPA